MRRRYTLAVLGAGVFLGLAGPGFTQDDARPPFDVWLSELKNEALARGIGSEVVSQALEGVTPLAVVVNRDQTQAEFTLDLEAYLARRLTRSAIRLGRTSLERHRKLLGRVQQAYGVDPATLVSVWGVESNFGRFSGVRPTVSALATLAYEPRRASFFREELFSALMILERGDIELSRMKGSWAGAMGQTQFMPSSYLKYAVDFDGDQRRDIWTSPPDIFGSIGNYLKAYGWMAGERWGRPVKIPATAERAVTEALTVRDTGCRALRELSEPLPLTRWHQLGVRLTSGKRLPASAHAASLLRVDGRAFLVYRNYEALLGYNCAHSYALSVAMLADRIAQR